MSVFRFDISVLQIMLSPTPLRWLDYSIFCKNCQKIFVCLFSCLFYIFCNVQAMFLLNITFLLHLCYKITTYHTILSYLIYYTHFPICSDSTYSFFSVSQFFCYIIYIYIFIFFSGCYFLCYYQRVYKIYQNS